jgi:hypothetical protein
LASVLRNRSLKHHRGERCRAAREQRAGVQAAAAASTTPLDAAVHRETVARLDAARLALLRERLAGDGRRGDWRAALATAFGLEPAPIGAVVAVLRRSLGAGAAHPRGACTE